jgi:hypothetical protein
MKAILKITLFMVTVWMVVSFFIINDLVKEKTKLQIEKENLFTLNEAVVIFSEGHKRGALRAYGNEMNFKAMYNSIEFDVDTIMERMYLEKLMK